MTKTTTTTTNRWMYRGFLIRKLSRFVFEVYDPLGVQVSTYMSRYQAKLTIDHMLRHPEAPPTKHQLKLKEGGRCVDCCKRREKEKAR